MALCRALALCTTDCQHSAVCTKINFLQRLQTVRVGLYLLFFFSSGNCGLGRSLCKYAEEHLWFQCIKGAAFREEPSENSHRCHARRYGWAWVWGIVGVRCPHNFTTCFREKAFFLNLCPSLLHFCLFVCFVPYCIFLLASKLFMALCYFLLWKVWIGHWPRAEISVGLGGMLCGSHTSILIEGQRRLVLITVITAALVDFTPASVPWRSLHLGKDLPTDIWSQKWEH